MNKTFKVARSLTRGTVVTSEAASSRQGKALKTVVAAVAAALVAGSAVAAESMIPTAPTGDGVVTATNTISWDEVGKQNVFTPEGQASILLANDKKEFTGDLWVVGKGTSANPMGLLAMGVNGEITNAGNIYITTEGDSWKANAMSASNGATAINQGTIVAKDAVAMHVSKNVQNQADSNTPNTIINGVNGKIYVEGSGQGMQLGGIDGSKATNEGLISVGKAAEGKTTIGVQIETNSNTFTNKGTIAAKDGTQAILVKKDGNTVPSNNIINLEAGSAVQGLIENQGTNTTINFNGMKGEVTIKSLADATGTKLNVKDGADVTLANTKQGSTFAELNVNNGKISASVVAEDNTFKKIVVGKDGTFNITALNSDYTASTTPDGKLEDGYKKTWDQYLVKNTLTLNGGTILQNGSALKRIKVGTDTEAGTLKLNGDYTFTSLVVGQKGVVTNSKTLNVTTLNLSGLNATNEATGKFTNKGTLTVGEVVVTNEVLDGSKVINDGTVVTSYKNLVKKAESGDTWSKTAFGTAIAGDNGSIVETEVKEITVDQLLAAQGENGFNNIWFKNATVVKGTGEGAKDLTLANLAGTKSLGTVATVEKTASVNKDTSVGALAFTKLTETDKKVSVGTTEGKTLTLTGDAAGNVFTGLTNQAIEVSGKLALGSADWTVGTLKVANDMTLTSGAALAINSAVDAGKIVATGADIAVNGAALSAESIYGGTVTLKNADLYLASEGKDPEQAKIAPQANEEAQKYDTAWNVNQVTNASGTSFVGYGVDNSVKAYAYEVANRASDSDVKAVAYVDKHLNFTNGALALGGFVNTSNGMVGTKQGSAIVIDTKAIATKNYNPEEAVFTGVTNNKTMTGTIVLTNLSSKAFEKQEDGSFTMNLGINGNIDTNYNFYNVNVANGLATVTVEQTDLDLLKSAGIYIAGDVERQVKAMEFTGNALTNAVIAGNAAIDAFGDNLDAQTDAVLKATNETLGGTTDKVVLEGDKLVTVSGGTLTPEEEAVVKAANDQLAAMDKAAGDYVVNSLNTAANMAVLGGAFTTALDINDQVTSTIARRTSLANLNVSRNEAGLTPWVDVFGSANEAKRLYGDGMGYESDIYGAVFGFDYTAACGGVLGLAVNVGTADANSVGDGLNVDSDTDFYGVSVYAAKQFGSFNVQADLGYTQTSNDLSTKGAFGGFSESLDADVFTFGVGTEFLASAGAVNVVPHAGIRLTTIDMDASEFGADYDKMTVYQLPLGVTFSGNFETGAWKVSPMVDLSVVPTFGDKDAVASFIGHEETTRVVDTNPVQAKLGVNAQNGAWTFGINYGLTAGGDDRMNNSFNANVRYTF